MILSALSLLLVAPFPTGAFGMQELCDKLTKTTGVLHTAAQPLPDYPVFVSVKSGDVKRVEKLVALAFHAEWQQHGSALRLTPIKPKNPLVGFVEWEKVAKKAFRDAGYGEFPLKDIYTAPAGTVFRFCNKPGLYVDKFTLAPKPKSIYYDIVISFFMKQAQGYYFGLPGVEFGQLPDSVKNALGEKANLALRATDENTVPQNQEAMVGLVKRSSKRDMGAVIHEKLLTTAANTLDIDFVLPLLDQSYHSIGLSEEAGTTYKKLFENYGAVVDLVYTDQAIIGRVPIAERLNPSQCRRSSLAWLTREVKPNEMIRLATLTEYANRQRNATSNSLNDIVALASNGIAIDNSSIGTYPYNVRLAHAFSQNDWKLITSSESISASRLSQPAQISLQNLLLNSLNSFIDGGTPPALWQSLEPNSLTVEAENEEELILNQANGKQIVGGTITTALDSGIFYGHPREPRKEEPLFWGGMRMKITQTIRGVGKEESFKTEICDVVLNTKNQPVPWQNLPTAHRAKFEEGMKMEVK